MLEQSLPGDVIEFSEEEAEQRGLPDGCITDGTAWVLLIESKISAKVSVDQLRRHLRTAARRGFSDCQLLVLSLHNLADRLPRGYLSIRWSDLYEWLRGESSRSGWARRCAEYFEVAETRGIEDDYLREGTLTVFSGIPFGPDEPYSYLQGKRILGLLRDELRKDARLRRDLGIDPQCPGRGAITGRGSDVVWDFIGLKAARGEKSFTKYPHLTLGIRAERLEAYVTVPNGVPAALRAELLGQDFADFEQRILAITHSLNKAVRSIQGAKPMVVLVQRHYATQRSPAVIDALLRFDPRTATERRLRRDRAVKYQPDWLNAAHYALWNRRSNLQLQIGMDFPYASCPLVRSRKIIEAVVQVWLACKPVLPALTRPTGTASRR